MEGPEQEEGHPLHCTWVLYLVGLPGWFPQPSLPSPPLLSPFTPRCARHASCFLVISISPLPPVGPHSLSSPLPSPPILSPILTPRCAGQASRTLVISISPPP